MIKSWTAVYRNEQQRCLWENEAVLRSINCTNKKNVFFILITNVRLKNKEKWSKKTTIVN